MNAAPRSLYEGLTATSDGVLECIPHRWTEIPVEDLISPVSICARCYVRQCKSTPPGAPTQRLEEFRCVLPIVHIGMDHVGTAHRWGDPVDAEGAPV